MLITFDDSPTFQTIAWTMDDLLYDLLYAMFAIFAVFLLFLSIRLK